MDRKQFLAMWAAWHEFDNAARHIETASLANVTERAKILEQKRAECWRRMIELQKAVARQGVIDDSTPAMIALQ